MKVSNKLLSALLFTLMISIISIDLSLKSVYLKIDLTDPFKNYVQVDIKPFKYLKINGGNTYTVTIRQAKQPDMKVMSSRKSFLKTTYDKDTLFIQFTIASNNHNDTPENLPKGIIIANPSTAAIYADGISCQVNDWTANKLQLSMSGNATASINKMNVNQLIFNGYHNSILNFRSENMVRNLNLHLSSNASVYMKDVTYSVFNPVLTQEAQLIFNARSAMRLRVP